MPPKTKKSNSDWRELLNGPNKSKPKTVSFGAKMRIFFVRLKYVLIAAVVAAACYGAYWLYANAFFDDFFGVGSQRISRIEFKTDGVITPKWLGTYLKLPKKTKLADVNIFAVKSSLEALSQVKSARVERIYPDRLRITVSEYIPMAKTQAKIDTRTVLYALSPEGVFYEPVCLNPSFLKNLPTLSGCALHFGGRTPKKLENADKLREFLAYTQAKMPSMRWAEINVADLESVAPLISASAEDGVKIIFATKDYPKQFDRLEYVLKYSKENKIEGIKQIDLSLKERADVKLRSQKK